MNRLAGERSPYLRQHRDNPVDWWPWGEAAFAEARARDVPVLLSVGYSACHWCHVMAHESFEDEATAEVMNRLFVNVKVDREERPDVDAVYMTAVQAMTGRGGWPMTVFCAPDGRPFYGGTYYPPTDRGGLPGFRRLLEAIEEAWRERRDEVLGRAAHLTGVLDRAGEVGGAMGGGGGAAPGWDSLDRAAADLAARFDDAWGGFGGAPKFPPAMSLDLLLRHHLRTGDPDALRIVERTLDAMAGGGLYDQLGGGFHRYSTDARWLVPHFEKMLYDQAALVRAYLHAWQVTGAPRHAEIVTGTVDYVLRDLLLPPGGFAAAEDADSEGVEGRFYVWSAEEFAEVVAGAVGTGAADAVAAWYGVSGAGNFEGANILWVPARAGGVAGVGPGERGAPVFRDAPDGLDAARAALLERRATRVRPGLDDKILCAWNAMFLRSLTEAAAAFGRADWMDAARANARFLLDGLRRPGGTGAPPGMTAGRLLRSWGSDVPAFAEDHAALLGALVSLAERDDVSWLGPASAIAADLCDLFADDGGFWATGSDAEALVTRPRDIQDHATPSANSLAVDALARLAALTGDDRWRRAAQRAALAVAPLLVEHPGALSELTAGLERLLAPPVEVAVVGDPSDASTAALEAVVHGRYRPTLVSVSAAPGTGAGLTPLLADRPLVDGRPAAYVCERFACRAPVTTPEALSAALDGA